MGRCTRLEERIYMVDMAEAGQPPREIATETGWSERTVRKWRQRAKQQGRAGMQMVLGRPKRGAMSTYPARFQEQLLTWRKAHPGWGPKTLHTELKRDAALEGEKLPSVAVIGRFLKEQGLPRPYEKHQELPQPKHHPADKPHELWEMDARGHGPVPDVGVISLIHLNDRCSHVRLMSYPVWVGHQRCVRHPDTEDYQTALRLAFTDWGLPRQIQVDHESIFVDNKSKSPFPTRLHLWLTALGIDLVFGRPSLPTDQGMTERSHQLWAAQCLQGQRYPDWMSFYWTLHQHRDFLNKDLPCASLGNLPPLLAFPDAIHSGRFYRPETEREQLDLNRVWLYLAPARWFRQVSNNGTFSLGGQVYYIGQSHPRTQLEITFDPSDQHLSCLDETGTLIARYPILGLSIDSLMGSMASFINLPLFQLALPFSWPDYQPARLFETIPA